MKADRDQFLEQGFVILRGMIPLDELEPLRQSYEILLDRQRQQWAREAGAGEPPGGVWESSNQPRLQAHDMAELHDRQTTPTLEFWRREYVQGVSSHLIDEEDAPPTAMLMMCNPTTDRGPAKWHRDFSPSLTCPTMAYADDILETGPRYVQWNIPLYDDDVLWVVPGSHIRPNTDEENASMRRDLCAPVPGGVQTRLNAGDGVAYILPLLHWGSNYSTRKRRTLHGGFARLTGWESTGWIRHLSDESQQLFTRWHERAESYMGHAETALRAAIARDAAGYRKALEVLAPGRGEKGLIKSTICLSKTARNIHLQHTRNSGSLTEVEKRWTELVHPMTLQWGPPLGECFTVEEAAVLWDRFRVVDECAQGEEEHYLPGFQERKTRYRFEEVPDELTAENWFGSWETGSLS